MPRPPYRFTKRKRFAGPNNTGGLGTKTLVQWDAEKQVHGWKDENNSIWLTAPGKMYGHLVASNTQPAELGDNWQITLSDGKQVRALYLIDPDNELYEPLGTLLSPAQAHVTNKRGEILLTTCPLLLPIVHPGDKQREMDLRWHTRKWYPTTQTMTLFRHDDEKDIYLWKDDVVGGIWETQPGSKFGRLKHWDGQPKGEEWRIPMTWPGRIYDNEIKPHEELWLMDPVNEQVKDVIGKFDVIRRSDGWVLYHAAYYPVLRMVNRLSMSEDEKAATSTVEDSLFETYEGVDEAVEECESESASDADSDFEPAVESDSESDPE